MKKFQAKVQEQFNKMCSLGKLFRVDIPGSKIWEIYLKSFVSDPKFRDPASSEHNCNNCNNFLKRYGNVVAIQDNKVISMFDVEAEDEYIPVAKALSEAIRAAKIKEVFFETFDSLNALPYEVCKRSHSKFRLGIEVNRKIYNQDEADKYGVVRVGEVRTFEHLYLELPKNFVNMSGKSVEAIVGEYRDPKDLFQKAMEIIPLDTLQLVKDLINQGSLLNGITYIPKVDKMIELKTLFDALPVGERDNWCWDKSYNLPYARFKNELIGTLCTELAEGMELNKACANWNKREDPSNKMKPTAPITKKQIEEAEKFIQENGYVESFNRRMATLEDIKVSEILHVNKGDGKLKTISVMEGVKATSTRHKRSEFKSIEEVTIEKFMKDILPGCTSVEAYLDNEHEGNLATLTTANDPNSKPIFRWPNNYSWTFNGNLAGKSQIEESVKALGGKTDGVLRFSIMWAEDSDNSDLDAHCQEKGYHHIYYADKVSGRTGGNLDIDITQPQSHKERTKKNVVENITYPTLSRMKDTEYQFFVHQFNDRGSTGFKAEIKFGDEVYNYEYNRRVSGNVKIATVTLKNGVFSIQHHLEPSAMVGVGKEIYNLQTGEFHKVNLVCFSPNHWLANEIGHKHYFFMLDGCKAPGPIRAFHNENLSMDLIPHRKVMEVLGSVRTVPSIEGQLSGLGFNATVKDELVVKLQGTHKRMLKIKFG